jgi:hypothetical protein
MNNLSVIFSNFNSFGKYNWPVIYFSTIILFIILLWSVKVYSPLPLKDSSSFFINTIHCGTSKECDIEIIKKIYRVKPFGEKSLEEVMTKLADF